MNIQLAGMIGAQEIIVILLVVLIFFGGKKIPELMKGLGKGVKEYKNAMNGFENEQSEKKKEEEKVSEQAHKSVNTDNTICETEKKF